MTVKRGQLGDNADTFMRIFSADARLNKQN